MIVPAMAAPVTVPRETAMQGSDIIAALAVAAALIPVAWHNPRLRSLGSYGRNAERLMWISIGALTVALLIR